MPRIVGQNHSNSKKIWLDHGRFLEVVERCWSGASIQGWIDFVMSEKLKQLKSILKGWSREVYGDMD